MLPQHYSNLQSQPDYGEQPHFSFSDADEDLYALGQALLQPVPPTQPLDLDGGVQTSVHVDLLPLTHEDRPPSETDSPWVYEYGRHELYMQSFNVQTDEDAHPGAGWLNYVTDNIGVTGHSRINTWTDLSHDGGTLVWRPEYTSFALPGTAIHFRSGMTLRQAALLEAQHFQSLIASFPSSRSIRLLREPSCEIHRASARREYAEWLAGIAQRAMNRPSALHNQEPLASLSRCTFEGDIFAEGQWLGMRRWAVELVLSNDHNQPSAFTAESLPTIINQAVNSYLDAERIPLRQAMQNSLVIRSWYIATDGGVSAVQDENNPPLPTIATGRTESTRPVLTLLMVVLPDESEWSRGLRGPALCRRLM